MSSEQTMEPNVAKLPVLEPATPHVVPQGPVLTEELFNAVIATVEYRLYDGTTTVACALKLRNGFAVVGYAASLPTTQFEPQLGMQLSLQDAKRKLGEALSLLVYELVCPEQFRTAPAIQAVLDGLKGETDV